MRQIHFQKTDWKHRFAHGGTLRNARRGRHERPLSTKEPIHLVLKANGEKIRGGFRTPKRYATIHQLCARYSKRFHVGVEQMSLQADHIHMVIRISRRSNFQNFSRVFSGQIAQVFGNEGLLTATTGPEYDANSRSVTDTPPRQAKRSPAPQQKLWKYRPFTRVVRGYRAYLTVKNYVQLNEQEALGKIPYRGSRLRGLEPEEWEMLWS